MYQKILRSKVCSVLMLFSLLFSFSIRAMRNQAEDQTLYERMKYDEIFDQTSILAKCPNILKNEGLEAVTFKQKITDKFNCVSQIFHVFLCGCCQKYRRHGAIRGLRKHNNIVLQLGNSAGERSNSDEETQSLVYHGNSEQELEISLGGNGDVGYNELENSDFDSSIEFQDELNKSSKKEEKLSEEASKALDKALIEDFWDKKQAAMKKTLGDPAFSTAVQAGSTISLFIASSLIFKNDLAKAFGLGGLSWTISHAIQRFSRAFYSINISPLSDDLEEYEQDYAKRKRFLSETLQKKIEKNFSIARKNPHVMKNTLDFSEIALRLPLKSKRLKSPVDCTEEIDEILGYNTKKAKKIISAFYNHYKRFSRKAVPLESPKTILYLQGPPGVGKTYITRYISKIMGTKAIELRVGEDVGSIIGKQGEPGSFLDSITKDGATRNAIIFIDELEKIVNKKNSSLDFFLPLLNPDEPTFYSPYLKADIDISHFCFITAGNDPIENEALKSRMTTVILEKLNKETKKKVVDNILLRELGENPDRSLVKEIEWITEQDKKPGVRLLRRDVYNRIREWQEHKDRVQKFPQIREAEARIQNEVRQRYVNFNSDLRKFNQEREERKKLKLIEDKKEK